MRVWIFFLNKGLTILFLVLPVTVSIAPILDIKSQLVLEENLPVSQVFLFPCSTPSIIWIERFSYPQLVPPCLSIFIYKYKHKQKTEKSKHKHIYSLINKKTNTNTKHKHTYTFINTNTKHMQKTQTHIYISINTNKNIKQKT